MSNERAWRKRAWLGCQSVIVAREIWHGIRAASGVVGRLLWLVFFPYSTQALKIRTLWCCSKLARCCQERCNDTGISTIACPWPCYCLDASDDKNQSCRGVKWVIPGCLEKDWDGTGSGSGFSDYIIGGFLPYLSLSLFSLEDTRRNH